MSGLFNHYKDFFGFSYTSVKYPSKINSICSKYITDNNISDAEIKNKLYNLISTTDKNDLDIQFI